jgi:hypothetical protein
MKYILTLIGLALSLQSHSAQLLSFGGVDGGGGKGVLCESNGQRTVESLDLYEAKYVWGYTVPASQNLDGEIKRVMPTYWTAEIEDPTQPIPKYDEKSFKSFNDMYQNGFVSLMKFIPTGARIRPTPDATIILDPPSNCQIVQVLVYLDEGIGAGSIAVDKEYWDLLDDQNRLAFFLHERDYKGRRDFTDTKTSDFIRKYIGALFATATFPSWAGALRHEKEVLKCTTSLDGSVDENTAVFYIAEIENPSEGLVPRTTFYFDQFGQFGKRNGPVEYKAENYTSMKFFEGENGEGSLGTDLIVNSILGGEHLGLEANPQCVPVNSSNCFYDWSLVKKMKDGSFLKERFTCENVQVINY